VFHVPIIPVAELLLAPARKALNLSIFGLCEIRFNKFVFRLCRVGFWNIIAGPTSTLSFYHVYIFIVEYCGTSGAAFDRICVEL
jgi:hypothetical protein